MILVHLDPQVPSISSTLEPFSGFFQPFWCHPRIPTRIIIVFDEQTDIPNSEPIPLQVPIEPPQIVFTTRGLQVDVRTDFVQEEPLGLHCLTKISVTCVADTASAACPAQSWSLAMTSITFAAVIWEADDPCSVNTAWIPESSFTLTQVSFKKKDWVFDAWPRFGSLVSWKAYPYI